MRWKTILLGLMGLALIIFSGVTTASLEPFNSDTYANILALLNIRADGALFMPVHTNLAKFPLYGLAFSLFGYSPATIVFIDAISAIGFMLLMSGCVYAFLKNKIDALDALAPFVYLAWLSPLFIYLTVNPGLRNLDVGLSFVWLLLVLQERLDRRAQILAILLGAVLVVNDPWFITSFILPAAVCLWLGQLFAAPLFPLRAKIKSVLPDQRAIQAASIALAALISGYVLRAIIGSSGFVHFVGVESQYEFVLRKYWFANVMSGLAHILKFFNADPAYPIPPEQAGNVVIVVLGVLGLVFGAFGKDRQMRALSLFALLASAIGVGVFALTNVSATTLSERYLLMVVISLIIGVAVLLGWLGRRAPFLRLAVVGVLLFSMLVNMRSIQNWLPHIRNPERVALQQNILAGLQKLGLRYGYGAYFDSLNTSFISGGDVLVRQLDCKNGRLAIKEWWSQSYWYEPAAYTGPTFVLHSISPGQDLAPQCSEAKLAAQFGAPRAYPITHEGKTLATAYVWDYNIASKLDR